MKPFSLTQLTEDFPMRHRGKLLTVRCATAAVPSKGLSALTEMIYLANCTLSAGRSPKPFHGEHRIFFLSFFGGRGLALILQSSEKANYGGDKEKKGL